MHFSFGMAYIFRDYVMSFRECTFGTSECEFKIHVFGRCLNWIPLDFFTWEGEPSLLTAQYVTQ